jgi:hypothetical protein
VSCRVVLRFSTINHDSIRLQTKSYTKMREADEFLFKMDIFNSLLLLCFLSVVVIVVRRRKLRKLQNARIKRLWIRPWIARRPDYGMYERLMVELEKEDRPGYKNFVRVYPEVFRQLIILVSPYIQRRNTNMRPAIPVALRLALTLRFLATGTIYFLFFIVYVAHIFHIQTYFSMSKYFLKKLNYFT